MFVYCVFSVFCVIVCLCVCVFVRQYLIQWGLHKSSFAIQDICRLAMSCNFSLSATAIQSGGWLKKVKHGLFHKTILLNKKLFYKTVLLNEKLFYRSFMLDKKVFTEKFCEIRSCFTNTFCEMITKYFTEPFCWINSNFTELLYELRSFSQNSSVE